MIEAVFKGRYKPQNRPKHCGIGFLISCLVFIHSATGLLPSGVTGAHVSAQHGSVEIGVGEGYGLPSAINPSQRFKHRGPTHLFAPATGNPAVALRFFGPGTQISRPSTTAGFAPKILRFPLRL